MAVVYVDPVMDDELTVWLKGERKGNARESRKTLYAGQGEGRRLDKRKSRRRTLLGCGKNDVSRET